MATFAATPAAAAPDPPHHSEEVRRRSRAIRKVVGQGRGGSKHRGAEGQVELGGKQGRQLHARKPEEEKIGDRVAQREP